MRGLVVGEVGRFLFVLFMVTGGWAGASGSMAPLRPELYFIPACVSSMEEILRNAEVRRYLLLYSAVIVPALLRSSAVTRWAYATHAVA